MALPSSLTILIAVCCLHGSPAWSLPKLPQSVAQQAVATSFVAALTSAPLASNAFDSTVYTHEYSDPLHPSCLRRIEVEGHIFHYHGTAAIGEDVSYRGCSPGEIKEFGIRKGAFDGTIAENGRISAGDGIHEGIWEPAVSEGGKDDFSLVDGIRWNDNNKWLVKDKPVSTKAGEFIFYAYIGFSGLAGVKGAYDAIQRKR